MRKRNIVSDIPSLRVGAYLRNLSFVLPVDGRNNLGWPEPLDKGIFRPSKTGGYNILCEHTILTLPLMTDIMPKGGTSIREPMEHLKSEFNYFNLRKNCGIKSAHCQNI